MCLVAAKLNKEKKKTFESGEGRTASKHFDVVEKIS